MTAEWRVPRGRREASNAWQNSEGSFLVPPSSPPSWSGSGNYFYLSSRLEGFDDTFDPLRCLRAFDRVQRSEWRKIVVDGLPDRSITVAARAAVDTPSGFVLPWETQVGDLQFASLRPPPWLAFVPDLSQGSLSSAIYRTTPRMLADTRELRRRQVERAMGSAPLLDHVRRITGRQMACNGSEAMSWSATLCSAQAENCSKRSPTYRPTTGRI